MRFPMKISAMSKIGTRVREARKAAGLTQKELAFKAGMKQSSLSELETGESASSTNLATLANVLEVSAYWLETGKGDPKPKQGVNLVSAPERRNPRLQFVTDEEWDLLDYFRGTDDDGRGAILETAQVQPRVVLPGIVHDKR
jgi:transcriptional regulator with XRE-family HTH domain